MFKAYDQLSQAELGYQVAWLCHRLGRISWLLAFHEAVEQLEEQNDLCSAEYALQALYAAGDPELVLRALSALDRPEGLAIHRKVLVEGLQHFQPREALIRQLWYGFRCSDTMQAALVDFFASPPPTGFRRYWSCWKVPMIWM